jgi:hypothetical protein
MADVSFTATGILAASGRQLTLTAGATITAGQVLYADSTDTDKLKPANAATSSATAAALYFALANCADEQRIPVLAIEPGSVLTCNGLTAGEVYVLSGNTSGSVAPAADLTAASTWRGVVVGVATSTTSLKLGLINSNTINA